MRSVMIGVAALGILLAAHAARPDCSNPGGSQGYEQCQAHPNCECTYQVISCPDGGWYTQYSVTSNCVGSGSGSGSGSGDGCQPARASKAIPKPGVVVRTATVCSTECNMMHRWLDDYRSVVKAYQDGRLITQGMEQHWSTGQYDVEVWREAHPGELPSTDGPALMSTDPKTCKVNDYASGCQWLLDHGLPQAACQIAYQHELVHVAQCGAAGGAFDRYDLADRARRELEAYNETLSDIQSWISMNCGG